MTSEREFVERVAELLRLFMEVDPEDLKRVVQEAHRCDGETMADPPQRFVVSRQALRMLWHFRCNLANVTIEVQPEEPAEAAEEVAQ